MSADTGLPCGSHDDTVPAARTFCQRGCVWHHAVVKRVSIRRDRPLDKQLREAAEYVSSGRIVAFPTDTLYGLAVSPRSAAALGRLFELKGRGASRTVPLIASDLAQVERIARLTPDVERLAGRFWPGPLTLVLPARPGLAAGAVERGRVAVRVPAHDVARALSAAAGFPITATSANRSGAAPAIDADAVAAALPSVDLLVDDGPAPGGLPSTIVDLCGEAPVLLRDGAVAWARVLESLRSAPDAP